MLEAYTFATLLEFAFWITSVLVGHTQMRLLRWTPERLWVNRPGTRGATSAEYFLKAGYAVIFMHRQFSLQPFSRHYSHSTNPFLDFLEIEPSPDKSTSPSNIAVTPSKREDLLDVLTTYKSVQQSGMLHTLNFVTVNDYLWLLRAVSQELSVLGRNVLYYLAAAVSDFFLPRQKMVCSSSPASTDC
jgi:phosphopantothenate-cysteine ligase